MAAKKVKLSLGLVTMTTRMEPAVDKDGESKDSHTVCTGPDNAKHDPVRVKQSVSCPSCSTTHSWTGGFAQKGTVRDGKMVVLTDEELAGTSGTAITGKEIPATLALHPREKVYAATVASDSVQNIAPDKGSEKHYALLRDALRDNPALVACMIWAPSTKNALWVLEVVDQRIIATKRCWPEDVRPAPAIAPTELSEAEVRVFGMLVEESVEDFDLSVYSDQARINREALIASKAGEAVPVTATVGPAVAAGGDLLAQIQASLDAKAPKAAPKAVKKAPAKKAAAKRTPAKRATKKATAA